MASEAAWRNAAVDVGAALLVALASHARAADKPITIAIYAPNAPFESGAERFASSTDWRSRSRRRRACRRWARRSRARPTSRPPSRNKQVDFAVIDGVYLAERGVPYAVLATATSGGDTAPRWALFSASVDQRRAAAGQEAEHGATGGRATPTSSSNALFDGEVQVGKFFARPAQGARHRLGGGGGVAATRPTRCSRPSREGKGLKKLFDVRDRVPEPGVLRSRRSGLAPDVVDKVKAAVLGARRGGPGARRLEGVVRPSRTARSPAAWARACAAR